MCAASLLSNALDVIYNMLLGTDEDWLSTPPGLIEERLRRQNSPILGLNLDDISNTGTADEEVSNTAPKDMGINHRAV